MKHANRTAPKFFTLSIAIFLFSLIAACSNPHEDQDKLDELNRLRQIQQLQPQLPSGKPGNVPSPTSVELQMLAATPTPTGGPAAASPTPAKPAGPITYPGTAAIQWGTCEIAGSGWLYINPDHTFRIVMLQPDLNGNCTSAGSAKVEWDFGGTTNAGALTFTTCNDQSELRSEGNGSYTDKEAAASATCVDSHNGDVMVKMDMKFTR